MTTKSSGFSLVELLVVIAIIGVLSAVGTLTYQGYIAGTKKKTAKNAMMQIALGQTEYYSNEGTYYYSDGCESDTLVDDNDGIDTIIEGHFDHPADADSIPNNLDLDSDGDCALGAAHPLGVCSDADEYEHGDGDFDDDGIPAEFAAALEREQWVAQVVEQASREDEIEALVDCPEAGDAEEPLELEHQQRRSAARDGHVGLSLIHI